MHPQVPDGTRRISEATSDRVSIYGRSLTLLEVAPPPVLEVKKLPVLKAERDAACEKFLQRNPDFVALNYLRESEYSQLDSTVDPETGDSKLQEIYLDYTGAMQGGRSHILRTAQLTTQLALGNPHSSSQTSMKSTSWVHKAEEAVLAHLNTSTDEYQVIWTANASGAARLVGQYYDFGKPHSGAAFAICADNHNSIHGIREEALEKGADVVYIPIKGDTLHMEVDKCAQILDGNYKAGNPWLQSKRYRSLTKSKSTGAVRKLLAYPGQSNVSGVKHSLDWIDYAHARGWDVLLDAAAFLPSNGLDLSKYKPDFITMSFYKLFGHPTGVGALVVRQEKAHLLLRKEGWFAGGTIAFNTVAGFGADREKAHEMAPGKDRFEEGTVNYANFIGVKCGLDYLKEVNNTGEHYRAKLDGAAWDPSVTGYNNMKSITLRVRQLTNYVLEELNTIHYPNGQKLVKVYGRSNIDDAKRGGTIPINIMDSNGDFVPYGLIEEMANRHHISIRTGCFCNPGIHEAYNFLTVKEVGQVLASMPDQLRRLDSTHTQWELNRCLNNNKKMLGCIRISVGFPTNFDDVYRLIVFIKSLLECDWSFDVPKYKQRVDCGVRLSQQVEVRKPQALVDDIMVVGDTIQI